MRGIATIVRSDSFRYATYSLRRSPLAMVGIAMILVVVLVAALAPVVAPHPDQVYKVNLKQKLLPPSAEHWFGTDDMGRDVASRMVYGARISLKIACVVVLLAATIGSLLGLISAYMGGLLGGSIMRVTDAFLAFPPLVLALSIQAALGPSVTNTMLTLALVWWTWYARLVRGQALSIKEELFIESARMLGASRMRIMFRHILPNCTGPIIVQATLQMGYAVITAAGLGFLGIGAQEPTPEWGLMVATGRAFIPKWWWMSTFPGFAIFWFVLGFCLLGDAIRDIYERS